MFQEIQNFRKTNISFLPPDVCVSEGKKCLLFGKFGVLCFLETPVLRFALLPYYRRYCLLLILFRNVILLVNSIKIWLNILVIFSRIWCLMNKDVKTFFHTFQWAFTCSKLTIETLEQGVKYVQS